MPWVTSFTFVIYLSVLWVLWPRSLASMLFHHGVYMWSVFSSKRHLLLSKVLHKTISRQAPVQWGLICSFWQISVGSNQISLVSAHLLHLFPFKMCFFPPTAIPTGGDYSCDSHVTSVDRACTVARSGQTNRTLWGAFLRRRLFTSHCAQAETQEAMFTLALITAVNCGKA